MTTKERCPTRLLADTPAETDAFGGHDNVASSIAEVVLTESGGKAIGLEGGWGAGKSTIVKLISQKLPQTNERDHRVVVFDMWSHQDDPLRRTFLESLITSVQDFGWVEKEKWDRKTAELARRRREDTTRVVPQLTGAGVMFAFTLLGIPVGSGLISAGARLLGSANASVVLVALLLVFGVLGVLTPAIWFGFVSGIRRWRRRSGTTESKDEEGLNDLPALLTRQASTESRTIVTQTPDPTSVEFESVFRDLLDEALKPENRKLLLVVDNLDRVQPSDALSIWSTLQTFLGQSDYQHARWLDRLWVLIPYDGNAILRLWDRSDSDATSSGLATSFLDKTFQLRFRVPPLLLSNWRGFLQVTLQQALPDHQESDFHDVYRAFAAKGGLETSAPTPRDLKIFVNQIGALHRERQDEFPLSHLACYVLLQKDGGSVRDVLLSKNELGFLSRNVGKQWRETIAALHFGVPAQEALQLLLRGPIQAALANGDGQTLSALASANPTGFWAVLEDTVPAGAEGWNSLAPVDLAKAATALVSSGVFDHADSRPEAKTLRSTIQTASVAVQAWNPFDAATAEGMVALGRLTGDSEELIPALLVGASNAPVEASEEEQEEGDSRTNRARVSPNAWMSSAFTLIEGLVDLGFSEQMRQGIRVPLGAQQWLDVSSEVANRDPDGRLLQYVHLQAIEEIDELLAQQAVPGQFDDDVFNAVQTAMATKSRTSMTTVTSGVFSHLQSGESIDSDQLVFMLKTLRLSKGAGLIKENDYEQFATSGWYLHHLHQTVSEGHPEATGECMLGYLMAVPDASEPEHVGNSQAGYEHLDELLQNPDTVPGSVDHFTVQVKEMGHLSVVFEMATGKRPVPSFLTSVLEVLLTSESVSKPPELVRAHWSLIRDTLETDKDNSQSFETFLRGLPGYDDLVADVIDGIFEVRESGLYVSLLKVSADATLATWCANGLSSVNRDAWVRHIRPQSALVDLVMRLNDRGAGLTFGPDYLDALVEYARKVSSASRGVMDRETWDELFKLLNAGQQELFCRRTYEVLEQSDGRASTKFFDLFGSKLSSRGLLANEVGFIDQVCRPLLDANNTRGLAWVADIADSHPSLFTQSKDQAAANDFMDRVRQRVDDAPEDDPTLPHLEKIGTALGIEREEPEAESEAPSKDLEDASE